jgi:flagellar biosynthesis/type III secretory pathway chaperone
MQSTEQLADLIRRKHHLLMELREVGRRQAAIVSGGDIASLLNLLAAKQELIAALQTVEQTLTPYYAQDPEQRVWKSPRDRADCAQRVVECNALLEEIVRLEKAGAERMTARRNEVAEQLQQVHSAAQVRGAYEAQRINRAS